MIASAHGHTATAELLLNHGADINAKDEDGKTALMYASQNGDTATAIPFFPNLSHVEQYQIPKGRDQEEIGGLLFP